MNEIKQQIYKKLEPMFLIHEADPQSRPVVIIMFAHVVRSSVRPHFLKQNKFQVKTMFAIGKTVGLAEWIIDDTCFVSIVLAKNSRKLH